MVALSEVESALRDAGLVPRGAFHPEPEDAVPPLPGGRPVGTVLLAGQVGASCWPAFLRERRAEPHPLDRWSARALAGVATRFEAAVVLPGDGPPHPPFQRWARRAEPVHPSPLGLLIHPDYGLWHAYRGALLLAAALELAPPDRRPSPCDSCRDRPCLDACPVDAFTPSGYDDAACAAHLEAGRGSACFETGCLARAACPVGAGHRYPADQARFHLTAFLRGRSRDRADARPPGRQST